MGRITFAGVVAGLVTAGMLLAVPAHADDTEYVGWLKKYGFNVTPKTQSSLITAGHSICTDLRGGASVTAEQAAVTRMIPGATSERVGNLITAAQLGLCPDTA